MEWPFIGCSDRNSPRGLAGLGLQATQPPLPPDLRQMRLVSAQGRATFAAGGAGLGRRELVGPTLRMRYLSGPARILPPYRGVHGSTSVTPLVSIRCP